MEDANYGPSQLLLNKKMTDKFYQVLAAVGDRKPEMLFSDLTLKQLKKEFVKPYMRGQTFFAGPSVINPSELSQIQIIETLVKEAEARDKISRDSVAEITEFNRTSDIMVFSTGHGYDPEDIVEAGFDVTHTYIRGGPGSSHSLLGLSKRAAGWVLTIVTGVLTAGLAKLVGWI
jgi:hypothetical protein